MTNIDYRKINSHMNYTTNELGKCVGVTPKTCLRWIEKGLKIVDGSKRPILILGKEAREFIRTNNIKNKFKLDPNQFLCMRCKVAVYGKRGSIKIHKDRKTAQCPICDAKMSRIIKSGRKDYHIASPPTQMSLLQGISNNQ